MLIVETIAKIRRLYYVQKKGFKTIAKELSLSKNTVKKIIKKDIKKPACSSIQRSYKALKGYEEPLTERLIYDRKEPPRRRRTAKKLCEELRALGYTGSYEAVNNFVNQWREEGASRLSGAFVPLSFAPGEAFQFDWSEEEIALDGELTRIKVAQIRLCYSRYFLLIAYPNEQLEMVLDAHDKAFQFFGGVCQKGIYDNMKTAVNVIHRGKAREYNSRFLEMASHHLFEPIACTPRSGWEKGQVERQVNTCRRNFFTPLCKVNSLQELNQQLERDCIAWSQARAHPEIKEKTIWSLYQEEQAHFLRYQGAFDACKLLASTVNTCSLVHFDTNSYSVDCHYVNKPVEIRVYAHELHFVSEGQLIGQHVRCFERDKMLYNAWHYVPLLSRKPGALRNGAPFKEWVLPEGLTTVRQGLQRYPDGDKQFIQLLLQVSKTSLSAVEAACQKAWQQGSCQSSLILSYLRSDNLIKSEEQLVGLTVKQKPRMDCSQYNQLLSTSFNQQETNHHDS